MQDPAQQHSPHAISSLEVGRQSPDSKPPAAAAAAAAVAAAAAAAAQPSGAQKAVGTKDVDPQKSLSSTHHCIVESSCHQQVRIPPLPMPFCQLTTL